jgi:hypothetical protein
VLLDGVRTGRTEGPYGEPWKRRVVCRMPPRPLGGLVMGLTRRRVARWPRPTPDHAQPEQPQEQAFVGQQVVYLSCPLPDRTGYGASVGGRVVVRD